MEPTPVVQPPVKPAAPPASPPVAKPAASPNPHASASAAPQTTRQAWAQVDSGLNKLRRLRLRTLACAIRIAEDMAASGHAVSPDHIEKIDSWMAIECCRHGLLAHVPDCDPPNITGE